MFIPVNMLDVYCKSKINYLGWNNRLKVKLLNSSMNFKSISKNTNFGTFFQASAPE